MNEMPLGLMWDDEKYIFCEIIPLLLCSMHAFTMHTK